MIYGMPTYISTDWDDDGGTGDETATVFKKGVVYMAMQIAPRVQSSLMILITLSTAVGCRHFLLFWRIRCHMVLLARSLGSC